VFYSLDQDAIAVCCGRLMRVFAPEKSAEAFVPLDTLTERVPA
jgi:hypothetical protein